MYEPRDISASLSTSMMESVKISAPSIKISAFVDSVRELRPTPYRKREWLSPLHPKGEWLTYLHKKGGVAYLFASKRGSGLLL